MIDNPRKFLREVFDAAVAAADPAICVPPHLPAPPAGRTLVIAAGKGAAAMARAAEDNWPDNIAGLALTRYGYGQPLDRIELVEASHPVPDAAGETAARRILDLAAGLGPDDLLLCLISGGASALLSLPAPGVTLAEKQALSRALLASGATISEMNTVRKHVSAIKGGRLAAATPARVATIMISDVPGDDPAEIGSGPSVPDPTTTADARAVLDRYGIEPPAGIAAWLANAEAETPKPGDPAFAKTTAIIAAAPKDGLAAAAACAEKSGVSIEILGDAIEGEARAVGQAHAALAQNAKGPRLLLSGGECTVTITGAGRGGPNTEYLLALALALDGAPGIHALAADTDGVDGSEDNAGALIGPDTLARAQTLGENAAARLADNDAHGFFAALDDLLVTGPTRTNVNDFRAVLVADARMSG